MAVTKKAKPKKTSQGEGPKTWQEAIRFHLAKVPEVDAVFANRAGDTIHVYSVVARFQEAIYDRLLKEEARIEKAFPEIAFEFHTRAHQGRNPSLSGPWGSELVYQR